MAASQEGSTVRKKENLPENKDYFTCPLYDSEGTEKLLCGISLASCTPALEQNLYADCNSFSGISLEELKIGSTVTGVVTDCIRSGVFVDIGVGCEGFVHKSTLQGQRVTCGSKMLVSVVSISLEERSISFKMESILNSEDIFDGRELSVPTKMTCICCNATFGTREEQVVHFKLDWHRYNLKQRILNCDPVTEEAFDNLADGISSLSGSESESEDTLSGEDSSGSDALFSPRRRRSKPRALPVQNIGRRERSSSATSTDTECDDSDTTSPRKSRIHPKIFLKNRAGKVVALYRCVVHGKENVPATHSDLISLIQSVPSQMKWAILLVGGGHFAAAVFNGAEVVRHKTFHRYTVRAKQGGAQSVRDSKGHQPKSAGATLRRYNEAALIKDIQDLLASWGEELRQCSRVFYRAPSFNRVALLGGKNPPFRKDDPRLRNVPFPTRRATHSEVLRIHKLLAGIECFGEHSDFVSNLPRSPRIHLGSKKSKKADVDAVSRNIFPPENDIPANLGFQNKNREHSRDSSVASNSETSYRLDLVEETINLQDSLKQYGATRKPRKKPGQKKKGSSSKRQQDPMVGEQYRIKNTLYSACKTGDVDCLTSIIATLNHPIEMKAISPIMEEPHHSSAFHRHKKKEEETGKRHHGGYATDEDVLKSDFRSHRVCLSGSLDSELGRYMSSGIQQLKNAEKDEEPVPTMDILKEAINEGGTTLLHVAAEAGNRDILTILMVNGADPTARNRQNQTPYMVTNDKETRNEFRRFWARFPDRYDYIKAQIPSPLTEEMEKEQSAKEAQRKKEKRKVRKDKIKEKKAVEQHEKAENDEKARFLSLSDREKRALAAEKRLMEEMTKRKEEIKVLSRCFQCASDITGKIPFEYNENRFCSMQCVKEHRKKPIAP